MLVNEVALGKVKVTNLKLIATREASKKPFKMMMNNTIYHSLYETSCISSFSYGKRSDEVTEMGEFTFHM